MLLARVLPVLLLALSMSLGGAAPGWCPVAPVITVPGHPGEPSEQGGAAPPPFGLLPDQSTPVEPDPPAAPPPVGDAAASEQPAVGSPQAPAGQEAPGARVAVLIYHNVCETASGLYTVSPDRLRADLTWLLGQGWRPLDFERFAAWHAGGLVLSGDYFLLTFDDGYQGVADHALPVLVELDVPAVLFLTTGDMNRGSALTTAGAISLVQSGLFSLQSHTHALHYQVQEPPALRWRAATCVVPAAELAADLRTANEIIKALGAPAPIAFAWPYGEHTAAANEVVRGVLPLIFGTQETLAEQGASLIGRFGIDWRGHDGLKALFPRFAHGAAKR